MYQIALCDDMTSELERIEWLLSEYGKRKPMLNYQAKKFDNAQDLIDWIKKEKAVPDLLLMDIFISGKTGLDAVKELRKDGYDVPVIFLTTSTEHALNAYEVDAIQYLVKPLNEGKFFHAMDMALDVFKKKQKEPLIMKVSGGIRQVYPEQIIYCEAQKNYQILYLKEEEVKVRMTGRELYGTLENFSQFLRCGSSYIVNLNHITTVDKKEVCMDNGKRIYLPRNKAAEFKKLYFSFYFGKE